MDRRAAVTVEVTNVDVQVAAARRRVRRTDPNLAWVPARSRCVGAVSATPLGTAWCGRAQPERARSGGGWSRSAPRPGAVPGRDRRLRKPDCPAPALTKAGVIRVPVGHFEPLLGNVLTASGAGLERHGRFRESSMGSLPCATWSDPCNIFTGTSRKPDGSSTARRTPRAALFEAPVAANGVRHRWGADSTAVGVKSDVPVSKALTNE